MTMTSEPNSAGLGNENASQRTGPELKKSVGYWTALALSIGSIAGTTLFFGQSIAASLSGNLAIIGLIILAIVSVYIAMLFGELVSMFPTAGGAYEFSKQAYNRFFSFIIGWIAWITGNFSVVLIIVGAVDLLFPTLSTLTVIAISIAIILLLNLIAYIGIEAGGIILIILSAILVGVIVVGSAIGLTSFDSTQLVPLVTHPFTSIGLVLFFIIESYFGWEGAAYLAEETKNASKIIPKAIIHATIIVGVLSVFSGIVFLGVFGWEAGSQIANPFGALVMNYAGPIGSSILNIFIFLSLLGAAAGVVITMPRLLLALARDKLFLGQFTQIHPRFHTPHKAVIFQSVVLIVFFFLGFASYERLLTLLLPLGLLMYMALILTVPVLRWKKPQLERPFTAPFGTIGSLFLVVLFIIITMIWLFSTPDAPALLRLSLSVVGFGLPLYLLVESYYDPKAILKMNDWFAHITIRMEKLMTRREFRNNIAEFLGDIRGKTLLELGCSDPITTELLNRVGPEGKVYVVHFSEKHLDIIRRNTEKQEWSANNNIFGEFIPVRDPHYYERIHPSIKKIDGMVSVGMLGYIQNMEAMLNDLKERVPIEGRIVFAEYSNFFHLLPEVEWLADKKEIERLFRKAGFSVQIEKKRRIFWNSIYLYGIRYSEDVAFI